MSAPTPLPSALELRELLEGLVGRDVNVTVRGRGVDPARGLGATVAEYVDDQMQLVALVAAELELAAAAGSAIGLVPAKEVEASVRYKELSASQIENFGEICNVLASLFNVDDAPHLRFTTMHVPGAALPADVGQWVTAHVARLDLDAEVVGYGSGALSIVVVPRT